MIVMYEKIEDYINKIKTLSKEAKMYTCIKQNVTETGIIQPMILIQIVENDIVSMVIYKEDLPLFQLASDQLFNVIPDILIREKAHASYADSYKNFENKTKEEYNKLLLILKDMAIKNSFTIIENASIQ